jgi:pimeloyl-ACP methyl ester carboxylesterase
MEDQSGANLGGWKKGVLGSMQRRDILTGLVAAIGSLAVGTDRSRGADGSNTLPSAALLKVPMSDGASISLEKNGTGPSLLLVHGTSGTRQSWARVIPPLKTRYQTFAMNRRGRVDSSDGSTFSLVREAEDIARVVDQLPAPVFAVGHSYGAIATLEALRLTAKVQRCVLYEPPLPVPGGIGGPSSDPVCSAVATGDNERAMLTFYKDFVQLPGPVIEGFRADPQWPVRVALAPTVCREVKAVSTYAFEPAKFAKVMTPTLFLLGSASPQSMAVSVRAGAAALPHSQVHMLPGQGHEAMYAAPDMLAAAIADFLSA